MHNSFAQYWIYIALIAFAWLMNVAGWVKKSTLFPASIVLAMLLLAVLRIDTGADYDSYVTMHERVGKADITDFFGITEPLYFLLIKFCYLFTDDYVLMFALTAVVISSFLFLAVQKLSINPSLSLLLYIVTTYYFISLNQVRQSISLVIFLYSIHCIVEKKTLKYYLLNIVGLGFHFSAAVALIIYPLCNIKIGRKGMWIILLLSIVLSPIIEKLFVTYLGTLDILYAQYFNEEHYMEKNYMAIGKLVIPNLMLIVSLLRFKNLTKYESVIFFLFFCSIVYYNIFFGKHIFIRPGMYFEICTILFVPILVKKAFDEYVGFATESFITLYFFGVTLYGILITGGQGVVPYKFFFSRW